MHYLDDIPFILLGAIGGVVKVLVSLLSMETLPTKARIAWLMLANAFVSGFAGYLGAILIGTVTPDDRIHVVTAGICGYLGVTALDLISEWWKKKATKT